ncbi:MAG: class I SAM-dependent RNA methyltransferase [Lentisphaeria bacterium]|nr:class I SAM-dependent RNA methyltransferase [Lentisphaeria bacterium]
MSAHSQIITIHDLAYGGDGVGLAADGRAVFVPFTIPGEEVDVEIVEEKQRFCRGRIKEVRVPSEFRVAPACPLFGRCGGCQYQHITYAEQVRFKCAQLVETLRRLGGLDIDAAVEPVIHSPKEYNYRNKLTLEPFERDGQIDYGFFSQVEGDFLSVEHCPLADPALNDLLPMARERGLVRGNRDKRLLLRQPAVGAAHAFFGKPGARADWLEEVVGGHRVKVPAHSFWQVNPAVGDHLAGQVARWSGNPPVDYVIDAYAGAGLFSLAAGDAFTKVCLIEADVAAVKASQWNHRHLGLKGREFMIGRTEKILPGLLRRAEKNRARMLVILDPPRGGCDQRVLEALLATPVRQIIYVSCNPGALARDLKSLRRDGGYQIENLSLADMFPQTAHFESAVALRHDG